MLDKSFEENVKSIHTTKNKIIALAKKLDNENETGSVMVSDEVILIGQLLNTLELQAYNYGYEYSKKFYNVG